MGHAKDQLRLRLGLLYRPHGVALKVTSDDDRDRAEASRNLEEDLQVVTGKSSTGVIPRIAFTPGMTRLPNAIPEKVRSAIAESIWNEHQLQSSLLMQFGQACGIEWTSALHCGVRFPPHSCPYPKPTYVELCNALLLTKCTALP